MLLWCCQKNTSSTRIKLFLSILTASQIKISSIFIKIQKYSAPNKIKFTIFAIQSNITRHAKKQKNMTVNEGKKSITETNPQLTWMLELADKDIKRVIIMIIYSKIKQTRKV